MLFTIAWRNIWRSRMRSMVVMLAIVIGIWSLAFMISFSLGMVRGYVDSAIENNLSHLQVHNPQFSADAEAQYFLDRTDERLAVIRQDTRVRAAAARTLVNGMLTTARSPRGVQIRGVDPAEEAALTRLDQKITDGSYFETQARHQLLLGDELAEKLKIRIRAKVVLTFQDAGGNITAAAFRVAGFFDTGNTPFDEGSVFVNRAELNALFGNPQAAHELAILLHRPEEMAAVQHSLQQSLPDGRVENYRELSPDVELYESQMQTSATIFISIIMLALLFGIVNTMLMAVLERYHELGMLMAIGMSKGRIFAMIVLETVLLAGAASLPGLLLGWTTVVWLGKSGIDLSAFAGSMEQFGLTQVIYPVLEASMYVQMAVAVVVTALLGAIYPAWKAVRLQPLSAIAR